SITPLLQYSNTPLLERITAFFSTTNNMTSTSSSNVSWTSTTARLYQIQTSLNLTSWPDTGLGTFAPSAGTSTTRNVLQTTTGTQREKIFPRCRNPPAALKIAVARRCQNSAKLSSIRRVP